MILRKAVYESNFEKLIVDARHLLHEVDNKISDALSRPITRNNYSQITNLLAHRLQSSFEMVFPEHRDELKRTFRFNLRLSSQFITGTQILLDLPSWDDIANDQDYKTVVFDVLSDLGGHCMAPHWIEEKLKVYLFFDLLTIYIFNQKLKIKFFTLTVKIIQSFRVVVKFLTPKLLPMVQLSRT